jgi:hypothetical protein
MTITHFEDFVNVNVLVGNILAALNSHGTYPSPHHQKRSSNMH